MYEVAVLAAAVACVSWTLTMAEITREFRGYVQSRCSGKRLAYLVTCYYCTSHYVTLAFMLLRPVLLLDGGVVGFTIALFVTVFIANVYLTVFHAMRAVLRGLRAWADSQEDN